MVHITTKVCAKCKEEKSISIEKKKNKCYASVGGWKMSVLNYTKKKKTSINIQLLIPTGNYSKQKYIILKNNPSQHQ